MELFQKSLILSLIVRVWDGIIACYRRSLLCRVVNAIVDWFKRGIIWRVLTAPSGLEERFRGSLFYRLLTWVFNAVPRLLNLIYRKMRPVADRSLFCRFLRFLGRRTLFFGGVVLLIMLASPYERWNNMYGFLLSTLLLCLLWVDCTFHPEQRIDVAQVGCWPVLFSTVTCLSLLWSQAFSLSFKFLFFHITAILLVLVLVTAVRSEEQLLHLLELVAAGLLIAGIFALYQRVSGIEANASFTDLELNANMPGRVYSFFQNPNAYASILVMFTPLMLALTFLAKTWRQRALFAAATAVSGVALIMTYSRGGWLALAFAGVVLMLLLCPKWVPLLIVVGIAAFPFLPSNITNRLLTIFVGGDSSISSRNYIYSSMVRLLKENWLLGVGLGTNALKRGVAYYDVYFASFPFVHAHNMVLEVWGESGIFAAISFVMTMFTTFRKGLRAKRQAATPLLRAMVAGSVAGLAGSMLFGLTDCTWVFPRVMVLFWALVGILYCGIKLSKGSVK